MKVGILKQRDLLISYKTTKKERLMPAIPEQCKAIAKAVENLNTQIRVMQDLCNRPYPGSAKPNFTGLIKERDAKQKQLTACIAAPPPMYSNLENGIANIYSQQGNYTNKPINLSLEFYTSINTANYDTNVRVIAFFTDPVPIQGKEYIFITQTGGRGGPYHNNTGSLNLNIELFFDVSIDYPLVDEDSTLNITLSTGSIKSFLGERSGAPVDSSGNIMLVGAAKFNGGQLDGSDCLLEVSGRLSPRPYF